MIRIEDNRLIVLEDDGNWIPYKKEIGVMHEECLSNYSQKKGLSSHGNIQEVVVNTNSCIYYNSTDYLGVFYLPGKISDEQLYQLELFSDMCLNCVSYLEVRKYGEKIEDFILVNDVASKFSSEVIQSYYNKGSKKM